MRYSNVAAAKNVDEQWNLAAWVLSLRNGDATLLQRAAEGEAPHEQIGKLAGTELQTPLHLGFEMG